MPGAGEERLRVVNIVKEVQAMFPKNEAGWACDEILRRIEEQHGNWGKCAIPDPDHEPPLRLFSPLAEEGARRVRRTDMSTEPCRFSRCSGTSSACSTS